MSRNQALLAIAAIVVGGCTGAGRSAGAARPGARPAPGPGSYKGSKGGDGPPDNQPIDEPNVGSHGGAASVAPDVPARAEAARDAELAVKAAGYIDAFTDSEPVLTRDGKRVVFVSDRDGLPQLYLGEIAHPDARPTRLVATSERMTEPFATRDGASVVFMSDTGADELWSIFRVGLDGKDLVELTPGDKLNRDGFIIPDGAPDQLFFSGRTMSASTSTIYVASTVTPGAARAIYTSEEPAYLVDVSRDGRWGLLRQFPSRSDNHVVLLELATGKSERIFPAHGQVTVFGAAFSPDGSRIYVATDGGKDQALVHALDRKGTITATATLVPPTAQIQGLAVAPRGGLVAVSLLAGNHAQIRLLDGKRLGARGVVKLPLGQGNATVFSQDGKRLVAEWSTPRSPTEVFSIETRTGKATPLRREPHPTLAGMPVIESSIVDIPAFDGGTIPTNVYLPSGEARQRHPVIVVYHGGPFGTSVIRWSVATAYFMSLGYVVVEPNVRGSGGFGRAFEAADNGPARLDAFKDVETSARWVGQQPWADKDRLVVFGASYGGFTALVALARWPDLWRAGVDMFGVVNMRTVMAATNGVLRKVLVLEYGDPVKDADFLDSISPLTASDRIVDPTFVYAGANDPRVPRSESDQIVSALRQRDVASEYMVAPDEGHSLARRDNQIAFYARCARFLEAHLK